MMCILFRFVNWESLKEEYTGIALRGSTYKKASTHFNNEQDSKQPVCLWRANTVSVISVLGEFAYLITRNAAEGPSHGSIMTATKAVFVNFDRRRLSA